MRVEFQEKSLVLIENYTMILNFMKIMKFQKSPAKRKLVRNEIQRLCLENDKIKNFTNYVKIIYDYQQSKL